MGRLSFLVGLASGLIYLVTAGPTFFWLDSGEFVAGAWTLGVTHPPGHPLASLLARALCILPVGTIAFRVALASALAAALAAALLVLVGHELVQRIGATARKHSDHATAAPSWFYPIALGASALIAALSYALWFQAVRAEVYALNLALVLSAVFSILRWDRNNDRRWLLLATLIGGLGLANHHLLILLAAVPALVFVLWRRRQAPLLRLILGLVLAGSMGLMTYAYLPLRASRSPLVNWGVPDTPSRFAWVVSAKAFQKAVHRGYEQPIRERSLAAAFALMGGTGPVAALLACGGLYLLWRRRPSRKVAALISGLIAFNIIGPLMVGFDPFNPDAHGYLALAVALCCALVGVFLVVGWRVLAGRFWLVRLLMPVLVVGLVVYQVATQLDRSRLDRHWAAEASAIELLQTQPPGALFFSSYFETIFNAWAVQATADLRPDLELVHRHFLDQPGYVEQIAGRDQRLGRLALGWRQRDRLWHGDLTLLQNERPITLEFDLNLPRAILRQLNPAGLAQSYGTSAASGSELHLARLERFRDAVGTVEQAETRRALVWIEYMLAQFSCRRSVLARIDQGAGSRQLDGQGPQVDFSRLAQVHLSQAEALAPAARYLSHLRQLCR
jgi:hypothetical protein